jgi:3-phytase
MNTSSIGTFLFLLLLLAGCGGQKQGDGADAEAVSGIPVFAEAYLTDRNEADNVDSPAIWHGPNGEHWIIATCKATDRLLVHDAATGRLVRHVGVSGSGPGQFSRPNGIAVVDDLAIIVERDNHRLQVFRLPSWTVLGSFGGNDLIKPYGIALRRDSSAYVLYVTDNYETADENIPPDAELGRRVKMFRMTVGEKSVTGELMGAFGATEGDGVLRVVESICVDTVHNRLLVADEDNSARDIKIYDLAGTFTGTVIGGGIFLYEPEGIVLYECPDGEGYYLCTDQDMADNTFHVFDRKSLKHVGSFKGAITANTDGIALTQRGVGDFLEGIFVAVHNDGNLGTFDWRPIAERLELRHRCPDLTDTDAAP